MSPWVPVYRIGLYLLFSLAIWQVASGVYIYLKAGVAQYLIGNAWQQSLQNPTQKRSQVQPWAWADTWPVARLRFPDFEEELMVLSGASGRTLAFGPGYLKSSTYPGLQGNTVILGHRDTHFNILGKLVAGQSILMQTTDGVTVHYQVKETLIIDETQTAVLHESNTAILTLITCYPFDAVVPGGSLRYVVIAEPA